VKFLVIGKARHGKTTFARALSDEMGLGYMDTSTPLVQVETARIEALGIKKETWDWERDRPNRPHLVATGDALKLVAPTFWVDACYARCDVCSGVRRQEELKAVVEKYNPVIFYVVRPGHPGDPNDNFDIFYDPWSMLLVAATSVADLRAAAERFSRGYREHP
jgi:hypothetical protein